MVSKFSYLTNLPLTIQMRVLSSVTNADMIMFMRRDATQRLKRQYKSL